MYESNEHEQDILNIVDAVQEDENEKSMKLETKKHIEENQECDVCKKMFSLLHFEDHKKTRIHKNAVLNVKKNKKRKQASNKKSIQSDLRPGSLMVFANTVPQRDKYYIRPGCDSTEENRAFHITLAAYLSLKIIMNQSIKNLKLSINDANWKLFGDIVIEITNENNQVEIYAIQCKQVSTKHNISVESLTEETGKFSIKRQSETLSLLRKKKNFDKTNFILYTTSQSSTEQKKITFELEQMTNWQIENNKKLWENRRLHISPSNKSHIVNSTNDTSNILTFKLYDKETLDTSLLKFYMFTNQKKITALKNNINALIETHFENTNVVAQDWIKFIKDYFTPVAGFKYSYKLGRDDVLLKIAEIFLTPFLLLPEGIVQEEKSNQLWNETIEGFDLVFCKNDFNLVHKVYGFIHTSIKCEINKDLNFSGKPVSISKNKIKNETVQDLLFRTYPEDEKSVSVKSLYVTLWKAGCIPLVITTESENHLILIINIITFLKEANIQLKFILATNFKVDFIDLAQNLKIFENLKDIDDESLLERIVNDIDIKVLDFSIKLKTIVDSNEEFLERVTLDVFLNMLLGNYFFDKTIVSSPENILKNTLVADDDVMDNIKKYFRSSKRFGNSQNNSDPHLTYMIGYGDEGNAKCIAVPPNI